MTQPLFEYKVTWFDTLFPLIACLTIFVFLLLVGGNFEIDIFCYTFSATILLIYFTRFNAVRILYFEEYMIVNFYLINKSLKVNYEEVQEVRFCSGISGMGFNLRFKFAINGEKYTFRIKKYDKKFTDFLKTKTNVIL